MGNLIGDPFDTFVKRQIEARQEALGQISSISADVLKYYTVKTPWLRLASSVNLESQDETDQRIAAASPQPSKESEVPFTGFNVTQKLINAGIPEDLILGNKLARSFILQGGTLGIDDPIPPFKDGDISLKKGLNYNDDLYTGAYGWGGISERGFVPMPGITSAKTTYYNNGALSKATIKVKCFSKTQFQLLDVLYLRPGYTLLLEFGWSTYLNSNPDTNNDGEVNESDLTVGSLQTYEGFKSQPLNFLLNPGSFKEGDKNQFRMLNLISKERRKYCGNYEAVYGTITNFKWSFGSDGSYDCEISLIGMGNVIESLKLNVIDPKKNNQSEETTPAYNVTFKQFLNNRIGDHVGGMVYANVGFEYYSETSGEILIASAKKEGLEDMREYDAKKIRDFYEEKWKDAKDRYDKKAGYKIENNNNNPLIGKKDSTKLNKIFYDIQQTGILEMGKTENYSQVLYTNFYNTEDGGIIISNTINGDKSLDGEIPSDSVFIKFGVLLTIIEENFNLFSKKDGFGGEKTPQIRFDFKRGSGLKNDDNYMSIIPPNISTNPQICLVNYRKPIIPGVDKKTGKDGVQEQDFPVSNSTANIINDYLGNAQNFLVEENPFIGRLFNVFLNLRFTARVLEAAPRNDDGAISVLSYIKAILEGINSSMGSINNFKVTYDESKGTIKIWDEIPKHGLVNKKDDEFTKINIFGVKNNQGSFVTNIGLDAEIPQDFAANISIGAQASGNNLQGNSVSFSNYNKGLIDRIIPENLDAYTIKNPVEGRDGNIKTAKEILKEKIFYTGQDKLSPVVAMYTLGGKDIGVKDINYNFTPEVCSDLTENYTNYIQLVQGMLAEKDIIPSPFFLPFNLNLEVEGISGIKLFERFKITDDILPPSYEKDSVDIIVKAINHDIDIKSWKTTIDTLSVPRHIPKIINYGEIKDPEDKKSEEEKYQDYLAEQNEPKEPSGEWEKFVTDTPWSAGFISWVMKESEIQFPYTYAHTIYAQKIRNGGYPWQALDPATTKIKLGDVVIKNRSSNKGTEEAPNWVMNTLTYNSSVWEGSSHGDIVVEVAEEEYSPGVFIKYTLVIGGNVGNTVKQKKWFLEKNGTLKSKKNVVVVLRPNTLGQWIANTAKKELIFMDGRKELSANIDFRDRLYEYYEVGLMNPGQYRKNGIYT